MSDNNPPTVEFVKDALRVAWAATKGPWTCIVQLSEVGVEKGPSIVCDPSAENADLQHIAKFDPPTVIALMEDWLRLREAVEYYANTGWDYDMARTALAKQG